MFSVKMSVQHNKDRAITIKKKKKIEQRLQNLEKISQPRIPYPAKLAVMSEE